MDAQLERCRSCGHALTAGGFCATCGQPAAEVAPPTPDGPETGAEADAVRPVPPPPVHQGPQPARYPLFADEPRLTDASDATRVDLTPVTPRGRRADPGPRRAATGWVAAAVGVVVLLALGGVVLLGDPDRGGQPAPGADAAQGPVSTAPDRGRSTGDSTDSGATGGGATGEPGAPSDLARLATATPPDTAPPSRDVDGDAVRYEAFNMLDGEPDTAWRMPGDASGQEIVLRLDQPTTIVGLGLINGYAKVEPGYDGYTANRRITRVEWVLDDGTVIPQDLTDGDLALQSVALDPVVTETITLRLVSVTAPADGPAGRDFTAISDVALVGTPA